jgi:hypothetical protein
MSSTVQTLKVETQEAQQKTSYLSHTLLRLSALMSLYFNKPTAAANDDDAVPELDDEHEDMMNYR